MAYFSGYMDTETDLFSNDDTQDIIVQQLRLLKKVVVENSSVKLWGTFVTYWGAFMLVFPLFCILRKFYPKAYNTRSWVEGIQTYLAENQFGYLSWTWQLAILPDDVFMKECGMDGVCFSRLCNMGCKLSGMGMLCSVFLMPVYYTAPNTRETVDVQDWVKRITTANIGPGSPRLIATVVASYIVFFYTMKLMLDELKWFTKMRHKFLAMPKARNYSIYIRNLPVDWRSDNAIHRFFQELGAEPLEVHVAIKIPKLQKRVAQRQDTVNKLEHAMAEMVKYGQRPQHIVVLDTLALKNIPGGILGGETVDSIEFYADQLEVQNKAIAERISELRIKLAARDGAENVMGNSSKSHAVGHEDVSFRTFVRTSSAGLLSDIAEETKASTDLIISGVDQAVSLVAGEQDGVPYSAGFVMFDKLAPVQTALQQSHIAVPYAMECTEAPDPKDIFWKNVGREHKDLHFWQLVSLAGTAATCLFWTIPVSFVSSLSSADALRHQFHWIDNLLNAAPWLVPFFEVFAPQLLVILNAMLPSILTVFAMLEGPISGAMVEASLFSKLSIFMIIQTFFISAISGGIFEELNHLVHDITAVVDLLAKSLPSQSTYFMQLAVIMTVTTFAVECLRVIPLTSAFARRMVGPNLTKKERRTPYLGMSPINVGTRFPHPDYLADMVLYFIIFLVYAVISPLVSFILYVCFIIMGTLLRHQLVYIYSKPESGGLIYLNFIQILAWCLLIGELTVSGLISLKKSPAAVMMFPLLVVTVLFITYINKRHMAIAKHLPTSLCLNRDRKFELSEISAAVKDAYLQPELKEPEVLPDIPEPPKMNREELWKETTTTEMSDDDEIPSLTSGRYADMIA